MTFSASLVARELLRIWPDFVDQHVEIWNA